MPEGPVRQAARVVLVSGDEVLLLSGRDPARPTAERFWFVPGGGAEAGETLEQAARREVYEEVGAQLGPLGPVVWRRTTSFVFDGRWFHQTEGFFVVRWPRFAPAPTGLSDLEVRSTIEARWWPLALLERADEPVYPDRLVSLVRDWILHGPPPQPVTIG